MVLIKVLLEATSPIYLTSQCSILLPTTLLLMGSTDFLLAIKWTLPITVSSMIFFSSCFLSFIKMESFHSCREPFAFSVLTVIFFLLDLKLRWSVPCGPNSVITFPGAVWLKPWYWWSYPVLPLGIQWHERRRQTIG